MSDAPSQENMEIILEFIQEIRDLLDQLEPSILALKSLCREEDAVDCSRQEELHNIFRLFHSMKGGAGFLQFSTIVQVAHTAETLLDDLRNGKLGLIPEHVDLLCQACDFTKDSLVTIEETMNDSDMADAANSLIACFHGLQSPPLASSCTATDKTSCQGQTTSPVTDIDLELPLKELRGAETLQNFLQESMELLDNIEANLLQWNGKTNEPETVNQLFRNIHSFKGNCGFMGLADLETLSHAVEDIMADIRAGSEADATKIADTFLTLLDTFREAVNDIRQGGSGSIDGLELYLQIIHDISPPSVADCNDTPQRLGEILMEQGVVTATDIDQALEKQLKPIGKILEEAGVATKQQIGEALKVQTKQQEDHPKETETAIAQKKSPVAARQDIRVDLEKLDNLITLVGELVIAENMIIQNSDLIGLELDNFNKAAQHMTKIVRDLQEMAITIRMIPIAGLFRRMMRLVHDLSRKSGKKVDLVLVGETTEVDKTVIEKITDPLVHLLRNALDHGLESPDERTLQGKPETGQLKIVASQEEGDIIISISDDGNGLNREAILAKALEKGLLDSQAFPSNDQEIFNLIFLPGFSTAKEVTDISGRGVGMDVVRKNLDSIKGKINVRSKQGKGTTIELRIPMTLAIIDGMQVQSGPSSYILPTLSIKEAIKATPDLITKTPDGQEFIRVRKHLLPVLRLHDLHNIVPRHNELHEGIMIVLEIGEKSICLFVDEIIGQQQTVIKGLSEYISTISDVRGVSGCTILGDGDVGLILDVRSLAEMNECQA